jgi:DNA-binding MarR family transcriptional regulator
MPSPRVEPGDPSDMLGYLVKHAHRRMTALADSALAPLHLGRAEYGVLRVLAAAEPLSQQTLAARLGVDPTTMVGLIDALEADGILTRAPDPADRRRNAIALTATGRAVFRKAASAYAAAETEFLAPLGDTGGERFRAELRALLGVDHAAARP